MWRVQHDVGGMSMGAEREKVWDLNNHLAGIDMVEIGRRDVMLFLALVDISSRIE